MEHYYKVTEIQEREEGKLFKEFSAYPTKAYTINYNRDYYFTLIFLENGIILKDGNEDENAVIFILEDWESEFKYSPNHLFKQVSEQWQMDDTDTWEWVKAILWGLEQKGHMV